MKNNLHRGHLGDGWEFSSPSHFAGGHLAATRCFCLSAANSTSTSTPTQNTGTSSGSSTLAQGNKNLIGNTTTSVKTANQTKNTSSTTNANKISAGGDINYTMVNGLAGADLSSLVGNLVSSGSGSGNAGAGGTVVDNSPPQGVVSTLANASSINWGIMAAIGGGLLAIYFFFFKKS